MAEKRFFRNPDIIHKFETVKEYERFTKEWMTSAVTFIELDKSKNKNGVPLMIIWTNFLGRVPIIKVAREVGFNHVWNEFIWCKPSHQIPRKADSSSSKQPDNVGKTYYNPLVTSNETLMRVYETALVVSPSPCPLPNQPHNVKIDGINNPPTAVVCGYHGQGVDHLPFLSVGEDPSMIDRCIDHHPHHKPSPVMVPLIRAYTNHETVILDPFSGSGSVGLVSKGLDRQYYGIEINKESVDLCNSRYQNHRKTKYFNSNSNASGGGVVVDDG
eukprot:TRINITY_DN6058_c0_g1_i1.p1 TRINITY_DN6058_c0_g1~~TRINITY_DN6058_c0_g1_i1.p1  ORF type:complete len:272 (+),score=67.97 TRINITY_DN6058_c0_g1_i1:214-1029(+)